MEILKSNYTITKNSTPITTNSEILNWLIEKNQIPSMKSGMKNLMQSIDKELLKIFGKPDDILVGEYVIKLWELEYGVLSFNVFTGEGKGTSIEVIGLNYEQINNKKYKEIIIDFLNSLNGIINEI